MVGEWEVWEIWTKENGQYYTRLPIELPGTEKVCYSGIGELLNRYREIESDAQARTDKRHRREVDELEAGIKSREAALDERLRTERHKLDDERRAIQAKCDEQRRELEAENRKRVFALEDEVRKGKQALEDVDARVRRSFRNDTIASVAFLLVVGTSVYCQITGKGSSSVSQILDGVATAGLALFFGFKVKSTSAA